VVSQQIKVPNMYMKLSRTVSPSVETITH